MRLVIGGCWEFPWFYCVRYQLALAEEARGAAGHRTYRTVEGGDEKHALGAARRFGHTPGIYFDAIRNGIAKINVGTDIRQPYEAALSEKHDVEYAQERVYKKTRWAIREFLRISGNRTLVTGGDA